MAGGPLGGILCQYCVVWWQAGVYSLSVPCAGGQVYGQHGGAQGSVCHGGAQFCPSASSFAVLPGFDSIVTCPRHKTALATKPDIKLGP